MTRGLLVYLAGPMTGLTLEQATGWRRLASERLEEAGFTILDPTRGLTFLKPDDVILDGYDGHQFESKHAVVLRDKFDSTRSDLLLINLLGISRVSIGTMMELAWASLAGKFAIVIRDKGGVYDHAFVNETAGILVDNLDDALDYIANTFKVR